MQRLIPTSESPQQSPIHANRHSAVIHPVTVATVTAMTTLLWMARPGTESSSVDLRVQAQSVSVDAQSYAMIQTENRMIHSGPFRIEGFPHEVVFVDDGFTISFPEQTFRIQRVQALWSDLGLDGVKEKIGDKGITHIDCTDGLRMYSGTERSLHVAHKDFLLILQAMSDPATISITIKDVPYTLTLEDGWSTILIPKQGTSTLTFERRMPPPISIAAMGKR